MPKITAKGLKELGYTRYKHENGKFYYKKEIQTSEKIQLVRVNYLLAISFSLDQVQKRWWCAINERKADEKQWFSTQLMNQSPETIEQVKSLTDVILRDRGDQVVEDAEVVN